MARTYIAVPVNPALATGALASVAKAHSENPEEARERGYTGPPRVIRLRDRTGPSVAERLATVEERTILMGARMAQFESHPVAGGAGIVERLAALESDLLDLRTRVGDSVASPPATTDPTPEQIEAYLSASQWWIRDASADNIGATGPAWRRRGLFALCYPYGLDPLEDLRCGEAVSDWEIRRRLSVANKASPAAPDPDRLAKVAEPTDDDLLNLFERAEYASGDTRAARRALYDLGREHGRAERDALLARAEKAERDFAALHADATRVMTEERAEIARLKGERDAYRERRDRAEDFLARIANGGRAVSTAELLPGDIALARAEGRVFVCPDGTGCALVPMPEETAAPTPIAHVPTESAGNAPSEAEMAAELRAAGRKPYPGGVLGLVDAWADMRAAKGAK